MKTVRGLRNEHESTPDLIGARAERASGLTVVASIVAAGLFLYAVRSVLLPFVLAGILAYVCNPLTHLLAARTPAPRWLSASAILLVLASLAALIGFLGFPPLWREITTVGHDLQGSVEGMARALMGDRTFFIAGATVDASQIGAYAASGLRSWLGDSSKMADVAAWSVAGLLGFSILWVLVAYFLIDAPRIAKGLLWLVPPRHRPFVSRIWSELDPILRRYFIGVALVVLYAATTAYIGLGIILGLQHAATLALLTGVLEILPVIGPAASAIIAGLVAINEAKSAWHIVAYVVYAVGLRVSIDQLVGPIVLGRAAQLRPVLIVFCFLAGGILFGVAGVLLAVPVALTVKVTLATLYNEPAPGQ